VARAPASREAILAATQRVLDRDGWQGTSAERIAAEAGVSRVTLHRHGLTKEVILGQLGEQAVERYREAMWPVLTGPETAGERLEHALEILCDLAEKNLGLLLALDAQANAAVFHEGSGEGALTRTVFTEPLERLLRDGEAEGSLRKLEDPLRTATVLFNLIGWTYIHLRSGHGWSPDTACEATLDLVLNGLKPAP